MADKFLNTGQGAVNLSNGTVNIIAAELGAVNLVPSKPVKTNATKQLVSEDLDISDVTNLATDLRLKSELAFTESDVAHTTPPAGELKLYAKTDKRLYKLNDDGDEKQIGNVYSTGSSSNKHLVVWQGGSGDHIENSSILYNQALSGLANVESLSNGTDEILMDGGIQLFTSGSIYLKGAIECDGNNITGVGALNNTILNAPILQSDGGVSMDMTYAPSVSQDIATKGYVDTHSTSGNYVKVDGTSTMTGDLKMADNAIELASGTNSSSIQSTTTLEIKDDNRIMLSRYTGGTNYYEFPLSLSAADPAIFKTYVQFNYQTRFSSSVYNEDPVFNNSYMEVRGKNGTDPTGEMSRQIFVRQQNHGTAGWWQGCQDTAPTYNDNDYYFGVIYSTGANRIPGYIQDDAINPPVQMNYTGQHRCYIMAPYSDDMEGKLFCATGKYMNYLRPGEECTTQKCITMNDAHPVVALCDTVKSKCVFGVCSGLEPEKRVFDSGAFQSLYDKEKSDTRLMINGIGEGAVLVIDGAVYENGDLLESYYCYAARQDDDIIRSTTVAKITCDIDFDNIPVEDVRMFIGTDEKTNQPIFEDVLNPDGTVAQQPKYDVRDITLDGVARRVALVGCVYMTS